MLWGELNEIDHNIVPYSKDPGDNIHTSRSRINKPSDQDANTTAISTVQGSGVINEFPMFSVDKSSCLTANELFGPKLEMDTWSDLLPSNYEISTGDGSIFGHDMIANVDDFLCPAGNVTDNTSQSVSISDIPLSSYQDQGCSSFQFINHSGGKRKAKDEDEERSKNMNINQTQQIPASKVQYGNSKYPLPMNKDLDELETISTLIDDNLEINIYFRLQDAVRKLDTRTRLCMGDSLLRLARSSIERQSGSETAWDSACGEANHGKRHMRMQVEETYTNPIDRTVAHLLFQRSSESFARPMNDKVPQLRSLHNP